MPSTSQKRLEELTQNSNRNSADEDEGALNSDEGTIFSPLWLENASFDSYK